MQCEECREAISARLDGEDAPGESAAVDAHLNSCAACRAFENTAARVTRLARTRVVGEEPDLTAGVLAALEAGGTTPAVPQPDEVNDAEEPVGVPRPRRAVMAVQAALAGLAVGQLGLAVSGIAATTDSAHHDMALMGASAAHFSHESAAWNLAMGVAFGWVALSGRHAAPALVPVIGAFLAALTLLSIPDLLADRVDPARLVGHGLVVAGFLLLLIHRNLTRGDDGGGRQKAEPAKRRGSLVSADPAPPRTPRAWEGGDGLSPVGRRAA